MQTPEQQYGSCRHGIPPLGRRLVLRIRCARPDDGQEPEETKQQNQYGSGLMSGRRAARFRRTLVVVKRKDLIQPSSLERGSAATRTVVRSISSAARWNELTHLSRINRR